MSERNIRPGRRLTMKVSLSPKARQLLVGLSRDLYMPMSYVLEAALLEYAEKRGRSVTNDA